MPKLKWGVGSCCYDVYFASPRLPAEALLCKGVLEITNLRRSEMFVTMPSLRVQHKFGGMRDGAQNRGGMRDTRNIEGGIRDENILARS